MTSKEEIIVRILQLRPELSRETVEIRINEKKTEIGKLLTDEGAAYMVANDYGIELSGEAVFKTKITIRDLKVGASDITVNGTIITIHPVRTFIRSNGNEGKLVRITLGDETGVTNVVLWDEKAEIAERELSHGDVIRVNHGYVKADLNGKPEVNVGRKGSITILSQSLTFKGVNDDKKVYTKIREISEGNSINLIGFIKKISDVSTFRRRDNKEGKVVRARLADDTGKIIAVFWDKKTEKILKSSRGNYIKIVDGHVRRGLMDSLEIHVRDESEVMLLHEKPKGVEAPPLIITKINRLTPRMSDIDVLARVTSVGQVRNFTKSSGEEGEVGEIFLTDKTGSIRLSLWDEMAEMLNKISTNDIVLVEGAYTRKGFGDSVILNLGKMGTIRLNPDIEEVKNLMSHSTVLTKIIELKPGFMASIEGKISEEPLIKNVVTRDGREIKVASLRIQDDTGEIRASFWGRLADKFEKQMLGIKIIVRNAYIKTGFVEDLELTSRSTTEIEILQKSIKETDVTSNI